MFSNNYSKAIKNITLISLPDGCPLAGPMERGGAKSAPHYTLPSRLNDLENITRGVFLSLSTPLPHPMGFTVAHCDLVVSCDRL